MARSTKKPSKAPAARNAGSRSGQSATKAKKATAKTQTKPAANSKAQAKPAADVNPAASEVLFIGIDLGTSRSVISASNGQRHWVESYVGWPRDFVARKALGDRVFFGAEALKHRLSLDVVRPLASGVIKEGTEHDEQAVAALIGHLIELAAPAPKQSIRVAAGAPAEALKVNQAALSQAVGKHTSDLIVVTESFAVAYGLNALNDAMIVDIGAGTVDFCIMHGAMPDERDQRSLTTAGDFVDQQLFDLLSEHYPNADLTLNMARQFKEQHGFVGTVRKKVEVTIPVEGRMVKHEISKELQRACESIMPAIAETIMDMIAKFDPEYQEQVRGNIILAGGGSQLHGISHYLAEATRGFAPCRFSCVDNPLYIGADGALALAQEAPKEYWVDLNKK